MRLCRACDTRKPPEGFYPDNGCSMATRYQCKECVKRLAREYHARHPERRRRYKHASRVRRFGLTTEQYAALLEKQNERCAICHVKPDVGEPSLHIDHDHKTNEVRGLLCSNCNMRLAWFEDHAVAAAAYIAAPPVKGIR